MQQKNFLENVISDADYKFLKSRLKADGYYEWYFIVWKDMNEVAALRTSDNRIFPAMSCDERERLYAGWTEAIHTVNRK